MRTPLLNIVLPYIVIILITEYEIISCENFFVVFVLIICVFFCQIIIFECNIFQSIIILFINSILTTYFLFSNIDSITKKYDLLPIRELTIKVKINKYLGKQVIGNETYHYNSGIVLQAPLVKKNLSGKEIRIQFTDSVKKEIVVNKNYIICGLLKLDEDNLYFNRCTLKESKIIDQIDNRTKIKNKFHNFIKLSCDENQMLYAFINGIILGNKSMMSEEKKKTFQQSGTLHLFAVSGLHIGFIYLILNCILKFLVPKIIFKELLISLILLQYLELVEYPPSAMRATLMILTWQFSKLLFKKNKLSSSLSLSAIIILTFNPSELLTVGFQLSYSVVISICVIYNKIFLFTENNALCNYLSKSVKISYSAFIGSLLIIYDYFSIIVPGSIIVNILVIPLTFFCINLIFLHFFVFLISDNYLFLYYIEITYSMIEYILTNFTIRNLTYFEIQKSNAKYDFIHFLYPLTFIFYNSFFKNKFLNLIYLCSLPVLIILVIQ